MFCTAGKRTERHLKPWPAPLLPRQAGFRCQNLWSDSGKRAPVARPHTHPAATAPNTRPQTATNNPGPRAATFHHTSASNAAYSKSAPTAASAAGNPSDPKAKGHTYTTTARATCPRTSGCYARTATLRWTLEHAEPPKGRKPLTPYQTQNSPPPQRGDGLSGADRPQAIGLSATSSGYHPRLDHRLLPGNVPRDTGRRAVSVH